MDTHGNKRKQPVAGSVKGGSKFAVKLAKLLFSLAAHDPIGSTLGTADILKEAFDKTLEKTVQNLRLEENRRQVLREVKQEALRESCTLDLDDLDREAQITLEAGFDFNSLLDNLQHLENLPPVWNARRAAPLRRGSRQYDHYHDLLVVRNVQALLPLLKTRPEFQDWLVAYVSRKAESLRDLSEAVRELIDDQMRRDIEFDQNYRKGLIERCNRVELFIRHDDLHDPETRQELDVAYVSVTLAREAVLGSGAVDISADRLLDTLRVDTNRLLILGQAGSGKTTLLRWIAIQAAKGALANDRTDLREEEQKQRRLGPDSSVWREKTPFLVRMREYQTRAFPEPAQLHQCPEVVATPSDRWAERLLKAGRAVLLLDGLDELSTTRRHEALVWIHRLAEQYSPENLFVVSSRPAALAEGALLADRFVAYEVCDLSRDGREQFVMNWHVAVARKLSPTPNVQQQLRRAEARMLEELKGNFSLAQLASNPLLCALLCALNRVSRERLPNNLQELCTRACQMLLKDRDDLQGLEQHATPDAYRMLTETQRRDAAQQIAYEMVKSPGGLLSEESVLTAIRHALGKRPGEDEARVKQVFEGLLKRSGLLRMSGSEDVEFVHNTLRDYLAGLTFAENTEVRDLLQRSDDKEGGQRWEQVLLFAVATGVHKPFVINMFRSLLDLKGLTADRRYYRELLLLKASGRKQYSLPPELQDRLGEVERRILPIDSLEKARAIAQMGESALEFLTWRADLPEQEAAACIHGLGMIESEEARRRLQMILEADHRSLVLEELAPNFSIDEMAIVVNVLCIPSIQAKIQEPLYGKQPYSDYIRELSPLSQLTQLKALYLNNTQVSDLSPLSQLPQLQWLNLNSTQVSDLSPLSQLTRLQRLYLDNTQVSDLSPLSQLPQLQWLNLNNTQVSDLSVLSLLTQLQILSLNNTQVSDLAVLSQLTQLQILNLDNTQASDLSPLNLLTQLEGLYLDNTQVSDLSPLSLLPQLQRLNLNNTQVSDLSPLSLLTQLQILSLNNTQVSDLSVLSQLPQLQILNLNNTQVSDLSVLSQLTQLQILSLNNTQVSDLSVLSQLTQLQILNLDNTQASDLSPLSQLTQLQRLYLDNTQVSDLSPLSQLPQLQRLNLNNTQVSDLSPLSLLTQLEALDVRGSQVSHDEITRFEAAFGSLGGPTMHILFE